MKVIIGLFLLCLSSKPLILYAQNSCFTPNRANGLCVHFRQCTFVTNQLEKHGSNLPMAFVNYLRRSRCNENESAIHLCCDVTFVNLDVEIPNSTQTVTSTAVPIKIDDKFSDAADDVPTPIPVLRNDLPYESQLNSNGLSVLNGINCGITAEDKIAFGEETALAEFPWMALLRYDTEKVFQCGGSLITHRYVLTAAHCVKGIKDTLIGVRLGDHNIETVKDCTLRGPAHRRTEICYVAEDYGIENVIAHPSYSYARLVNDIALIKLDRAVESKIHIKPICLPISEQSSFQNLQPTPKVIIAGWGLTETGSTSKVLMKAKVAIRDLGVCQTIFKRLMFSNNHICAGGEDRIDSCRGDSGGPLFFTAPYKTTPRYIQYGVVSAGGIQCGSTMAYPGVYANVTELMPWLTANIDE